MTTTAETPTAAGTVTVSADPAAVWAKVTDLAGIADRNPETYRARWLAGGGPEPGGRFRGHNRNGIFRWSTTCRVTDSRPGSAFAFRVTLLGMAVADWRYDLRAAGPGACEVTESTWDRRGRVVRIVAPIGTGVRDRTGRNQLNIDQTLERLQAVFA